MAINIAGQQILAQPVSGFLQGRAIRQAEQESGARMKALEMAEGRAQQQADREQALFDEASKMRNTQVLYRALSQIESSDDPVSAANTLAQSPEITEIFQRMGKDPTEGFRGKSAQEIKRAAAEGRAQLEPFLQQKADEPYTLGKGEKRMIGGKVIAENTTPDEDDWTNPEPVMIGGRKVMAQVNKRTGDPRIVPGATPIEPAGDKGGDPFAKANVLRDEFNALTKDYGTVAASYNTIKSLAKEPSAAGDIGLLTSYMRMIDPGSTVREGEFATAENAGGVPDKVTARYNNLLRGERLSDVQRADFVKQAGSMFQSRKSQYSKTRTTYRDLATRAEVNPLDVIGAEEAEAPPADAAPSSAPTATGPNGQKLILKDGQWVPFNG